MDVERVSELLGELVAGRPPAPDGLVEVVPQPPGPVAGILAFAAHHVVAADVDPAWVHEQLPPGDLVAPVGPVFVGALAERLGVRPSSL
ncbi:MAG: GNAT family N-acetyltransferase, partial [Acidimicrobiia bacterium]|nr:GNAT family N-acetyltransferase [Acidimicrobiia bacterium]